MIDADASGQPVLEDGRPGELLHDLKPWSGTAEENASDPLPDIGERLAGSRVAQTRQHLDIRSQVSRGDAEMMKCQPAHSGILNATDAAPAGSRPAPSRQPGVGSQDSSVPSHPKSDLPSALAIASFPVHRPVKTGRPG